MPRSEDGFVLVVRVWLHDGVPVARLLSYPPAGPPSDDVTTVAGRDDIIAAIERWMSDLPSGTLDADPDPA